MNQLPITSEFVTCCSGCGLSTWELGTSDNSCRSLGICNNVAHIREKSCRAIKILPVC